MLLDDNGLPRVVQRIEVLPQIGNNSLLLLRLFNGKVVTARVNTQASHMCRTLQEDPEAMYDEWENIVKGRHFPKAAIAERAVVSHTGK